MPSNQPHLSMSYMPNVAPVSVPISPANATTPTTPTAGSNSSTPNASRVQQQVQQKNPKLYKTELCRSWMETGRCNYGDRCQYAHGEKEKRPVPRHPKYKTDPCQSYHKTGYCPYGPRCHFIHNEGPGQLKALISANEQALRMVQDLAALGLADHSKKSMLTTSSSAASLGAYANQQGTNSPYNGEMFPAQKSNSAATFLNGHHQYLGKAQSFGSNPENFIFSPMNLPSPLAHPQHQQQQQRQIGRNLGGNPLGTSYPETNNLNYWSNEMAGLESPMNQQKLAFLEHQRPNALGLFANNGFHSQQISPTFFTPLDEMLKQQSKSPNFPFSMNGNGCGQQQQQMNGLTPILGANKGKNECGTDELDAQQLLGNFCSSDDENSRSSIISSNIDSGNESPLATFDEEARMRQAEQFKQSQTPLPVAEEPQQRRSSDGDTTSNNAEAASSRVCDSTASSSMASLLSSSSSNSSSSTAHQQQHSPRNFFTNPTIQPASIESSSSASRVANSQKIRLPVFERLSLNQ